MERAADAADVARPGSEAAPLPSFSEALRVWLRIGLINFGGPAGQIALMHRVMVEERRWIDEARFLHALNYCMLLPGPEAMQLAAYLGWLMHGTRGGVAAGVLFVLPGFIVLLGLSVAYVTLGGVPAVQGILFGLKAAVLAIVVEAMLRVSRRALKSRTAVVLAVAAFVAIAFFDAPFPLIVAAAAIAGFLIAQFSPGGGASEPAMSEPSVKRASASAQAARAALVWSAIWLIPVAAVLLVLGRRHVFSEEALFFSKAAVVTFGGAYAVLAYVAQQAVEVYQWLRPDEMLTGLGLAETTPGPLILVLVFVGFLGGWRADSGLDPLTAGVLGATITAWVTFVPSFLFIFAGAPFIEQLRQNRRLAAALAAVTAAIVGVIANLAFWFGLHVLFTEVGTFAAGPLSVPVPDLTSLDLPAALIALVAGVALLRFHVGVVPVLAAAAAAGAAMRLLG